MKKSLVLALNHKAPELVVLTRICLCKKRYSYFKRFINVVLGVILKAVHIIK